MVPGSLLQFADGQSSAAQLTYTVINAPQDGNLLLNGAPASSFTQADINAGQVTYQEIVANATADSFGFTVSNPAGATTALQSFGITIAPSVPGGQYSFFGPPGGSINLVQSPDGNNLPAAVPGVFNLLVITAPTQASYPVPSGYQGVAIYVGGTDNALSLVAGDVNVDDAGPGDSIFGGPGFSTIGGGQFDTIVGGSNNEFIDGSRGHQLITGGSGGDETIFGGSADTINGGGSAANIRVGGYQFDTITGGSGTEFIDGSTGNQLLTGGAAGNETIWGGAGDTINGGTGANVTIGGAQFDTINGGTGTEFIDGSTGNQLITVGSAGNETIWGGSGDTIFGGTAQALIGFSTVPGAGAEFFSNNGTTAAASLDTVAGFSQTQGDRILLNGASSVDAVLASATTVNGNTTITFADGSKLELSGVSNVDSTFFA
jgi:Ca2+-binding RTX toxin-like protein